ncbi:TetR/AcrR family transcriptional regulator C-terminal domain-containing protein [Kribbella jiaozuonensis]|uniref:Tetracyclin repressor domain-containing protein n=1 Tax=Kribbella jiaozuonensis TaxID=2575441 RepID=A0A4U3LX49_9ACTN|nr:TetR/AcrR family transcriptional regulator C-terminal domain-containing protein [Kribbella jiaozuonensis]TKK80149.1 tetracyclin repressor domain-containing protein [Kribbella jiaozuonensis]
MRMTQSDVIEAAFAVLEEEGLERLSLRGVARRLDAHLNSVSWQVKTKFALIETMADTIVGEVAVDDLVAGGTDPVERVAVVARRYRAAMLAHRDGGRLVAGTFTGTGKTLRVAEVIVGSLLEAGYAEADAARLCWAIVYFTIGLTQEEQTPSDNLHGNADDLLSSGAYPALTKVGTALLLDDPFDTRFEYGLTRLLSRP